MIEETSTQTPELKPCRHMEKWVSALSDGSLTGVTRWYTQLHVAGCKQCHAALEGLQRMRERLQTLRVVDSASALQTLPPERHEALDAALDEIEKRLH